MSSHRAVVRNGRLILDEPTALPEGQWVELEETVELDETDPYSDELQLNADDHQRLDGMIERGMSAARHG